MPVLLCGPMQLPNNICQWSCIGPYSCLKNVQVLLCGPRQLAKNFCQYNCVGPQICPETDASAPVYAHATTKQDLPEVLYGPKELPPNFAGAPVGLDNW